MKKAPIVINLIVNKNKIGNKKKQYQLLRQDNIHDTYLKMNELDKLDVNYFNVNMIVWFRV